MIPDHLAWIWRAWHRLHLDRPWWGGGMGPVVPGRIPWATVRDWAAFHDLSGDDMLLLDTCIRALDGEFLAHHAKRVKAAAP